MSGVLSFLWITIYFHERILIAILFMGGIKSEPGGRSGVILSPPLFASLVNWFNETMPLDLLSFYFISRERQKINGFLDAIFLAI